MCSLQAEKVAAGMIAERRMEGSIDQIEGIVYFKSQWMWAWHGEGAWHGKTINFVDHLLVFLLFFAKNKVF